MSVRVDSRFSSGSVAAVRVVEGGADTTVHFAADPGGASESLWFHFRIVESAPQQPHPESVTLTWAFLRNLSGCQSAAALRPVYRGDNQGWERAKAGQLSMAEDGQSCVSWTLPYPSPSIDVALCYPYGQTELETLVRKSKEYWSSSVIGLSQGGRPIQRLSNSVERGPASRPGIFLVARQHAGETPGSWVLDGILDNFSRTREKRILAWAVPLVDVGGIERGQYGRDGFAFDLDHSWGNPPLRHETRVIQDDIHEWRTRCQPALVLDVQAAGGSASEGLFCRLSPPGDESSAARDAEKWANVFREALTEEYAAAEFRRPPAPSHHAAGLSLAAYARETLGVGGLSIEAPYALCGKTVMTPKQYREVGHRIARAMLRRLLA